MRDANTGLGAPDLLSMVGAGRDRTCRVRVICKMQAEGSEQAYRELSLAQVSMPHWRGFRCFHMRSGE